MSNLNPRQRKAVGKTIAIIVVAMTLFCTLFYVRITSPTILSDRELKANGGLVLETPRRFTDFALVDHHGQPFTKENLKGKWTLIFFGFTQCPDICPTTMATLNKTVDKLRSSEKEAYQVVMVSVDPERDTVDKLAEYVPFFNPDFVGVTGDPYQILNLTAQLNIAYHKVEMGEADYTVDHSSQIVLINPMGDYHAILRAPHYPETLRVVLRSIRGSFAH